jgi:hypothetical protein
MDSIERHRVWKRKHPDFPLTVSPNGQWSKKVRGRTVYFGRLADRDAALELWLAEKATYWPAWLRRLATGALPSATCAAGT